MNYLLKGVSGQTARQTLKMKKILTFAVLLFCLCTLALLGGCGAKTAYSREEVLKLTDEFFEDKAELVSEKIVNAAEGTADYIFRSQYGFEFTVYSVIDVGQPVAIRSKGLRTDYNKCLMQAYSSGISAAADKWDVSYSINSVLGSLEMSVRGIDDLGNSISFLGEVYELLGEMLIDEAPNGNPMHFVPIQFYIRKGDINVLSGKLKENFSSYAEAGEDYFKRCAEIAYMHEVRSGKLQDSEITEEHFAEIPQKIIRELYINGEKFESKRYSPKFFYDVEIDDYVVYAGYGIATEYDGGVIDAMQQEIIENYLGEGYKTSSITQTATYSIGADSFEITCPRKWYFADLERKECVELDRCEFRKNGELLSIKPRKEPRFWGEEAGKCFFYLALSDYAELLDMDYSIDGQAGIIRLTARSK